MSKIEVKNKKVLLVGLGILGGGVSTAKWLISNGAKLTITDLKGKEDLKKSLSKLKAYNIKYVLGEHREEDFLKADLIVVNQDVPYNSKYIKFALKNKKPILSELAIFSNLCKSKYQIAVTGTRGKTTTVNWIHHFIKGSKLTGNSPKAPLLKVLEKIKEETPVVLEVPSYQLEYPAKDFAPKVAVITNIFRDHINRHGTEEEYAKAKMAIFKNQKKGDFLIANFDNKWTKDILKKNLKQDILLYSLKKLPKKILEGIYLDDKGVVLRKDGVDELYLNKSDIPKEFGNHNISNLMICILVSEIFGISRKDFIKKIETIPVVDFRQQQIFKGLIRGRELNIFNDTAATSPDATIAAIDRFKGNSLFIMGGTDKELDFKSLAKKMVKDLTQKDVVFLEGSATDKLIKHLSKDWGKKIKIYSTLEDCILESKERFFAKGGKKYKNIVLSPASKSFEKFKNEYDRGVQFNEISARVFLV